VNTLIFEEINRCSSPEELFDLVADYFQGQGFGGVCYLAPAGPGGPFTMMDRGMPEAFMARYREQRLDRFDPLPGIAFRLGHPASVHEIIEQTPSLNPDEQCYIEAVKNAGLSDTLVIPTYGPFARPGLIALAAPAHPELVAQMDKPLAAAVAQQVHTRMELLQIHDPPPGLSPREREILKWLGRGKSNADIATILSLAVPTVVTHVQRIYAKLRVHDRVSAVAKAMTLHYL
jgi:DNA-binding CsgD family transcriptional regulator